MNIKNLNSRFFAIAYFVILAVYALAYYVLPPAVTGIEKLTFVDAVYFSAVTITTLGYGDIHFQQDWARLLSASEAVLGVVTIGFFLNSLSNEWAKKSIEAEKQISEKEYIRRETAALVGRYWLIERDYWRFMYLADVITTPIGERNTPCSGAQLLDRMQSAFPFSRMKDLFRPTLLMLDRHQKPAVAAYFETEKSISQGIESILRDVDLEVWGELRSLFQSYLSVDPWGDPFGAIQEAAERSMVNSKDELVSLVIRMIESTDGEPTALPSNVISPYVVLYNSVRRKVTLLNAIRNLIKIYSSGVNYPDYARPIQKLA